MLLMAATIHMDIAGGQLRTLARHGKSPGGVHLYHLYDDADPEGEYRGEPQEFPLSDLGHQLDRAAAKLERTSNRTNAFPVMVTYGNMEYGVVLSEGRVVACISLRPARQDVMTTKLPIERRPN